MRSKPRRMSFKYAPNVFGTHFNRDNSDFQIAILRAILFKCEGCEKKSALIIIESFLLFWAILPQLGLACMHARVTTV